MRIRTNACAGGLPVGKRPMWAVACLESSSPESGSGSDSESLRGGEAERGSSGSSSSPRERGSTSEMVVLVVGTGMVGN